MYNTGEKILMTQYSRFCLFKGKSVYSLVQVVIKTCV